MAWFKPNDLRVPFLVLRNKDIPPDLVQNADIYSRNLYAVSFLFLAIIKKLNFN